jgi:hypothetical protein
MFVRGPKYAAAMSSAFIRNHEATHQVFAVVEFGWSPGPITVREGERAYGCCMTIPPELPEWEDGMELLPFTSWPQAHQRNLEQRVLVSLAGDVGACILSPLDDQEEPVAAEAIALAKNHPADEADLEWADEAVSSPVIPSDAERIARMARIAHREDMLSAHRWIEFLHAQCMDMVKHHEAQIRELADVLREHPVLSAAAVAAVLAHDPVALPC